MQASKAPRRLWILAALALVGLGISIYQSQQYYSLRSGALGFRSFCNISSTVNCDAVTLSRFAELAGGIPLSSFAAGWFLALGVIALLSMLADWRRDGLRIALGMAAFGSVFSLVYLYIMAGVIKSFCILCLGIDAVNFIGLAIVLSLKAQWKNGGKTDMGRVRTALGIIAGCLIVVLISLKGLEPEQVDPKTTDLLAQQVLATDPVAVNSGEELPSVGSASAPITIVEYADFQCPGCKTGATVVKMLLNRYPGKLRLVYRNYPLDSECNKALKNKMHPAACEAAKVAICSHKQGKFQEAFESLFENQSKLAPGNVTKFLEHSTIDLKALEACVSSPETEAALARDVDEGERLAIKSTPTFFVNGKRMEGALPLRAWDQIIGALLAK